MLSSLFLTTRRFLIKTKDTLNTDESMVYAGFALGFIHVMIKICLLKIH